MTFAVNPKSAVPLYHQVYLVLRQQLLEGQFEPGVALPGEEPLREQFGVSRVTIRKTLAALEKEGLVERVRGKGTYPIAKPANDRANISGLYENLISVGLQTQAKLLEFEVLPTPAFLNTNEQNFGQNVLRVTRVRRLKKDPFAFMRSYVPEAMAKHLSKRDLGNRPLLMVLEGASVMPSVAEQSLTAAAATEEHARHLNVAIGSPLIHMTRLSRNEKGQAIEYFESYYRPDKYEYRLTLSRGRTSDAPRWVPIG